MSDAQTLLTYQKFVDEMVSLAKQSVSANRIAAHGHSERANDAALPLNNNERAKKNFCEGLSKEQRTTLVQVLIDERVAAIHDVLAYLEWQFQLTGWKFQGLTVLSPTRHKKPCTETIFPV